MPNIDVVQQFRVLVLPIFFFASDAVTDISINTTGTGQ